jgi:hypothetical protein
MMGIPGHLRLCLASASTFMRAEGGGLGFLFVSYFTAQAQLWKRKTDSDGAVSWGLARTILNWIRYFP